MNPGSTYLHGSTMPPRLSLDSDFDPLGKTQSDYLRVECAKRGRRIYSCREHTETVTT
jgi:hypothetical protein